MSSQKQLLADLRQPIQVAPANESENEAFQFILTAMEHMNRESVNLFRAEIARQQGMANLLALIDGHTALRELYGPRDGSAPRQAGS